MRALRMSCVSVAIAAFVGSAGCGAANQTAADRTEMREPASQARVTSADIAPRSEDATSLSVPPGVDTPPSETAGTQTAVADPSGAATPARTMTDAQIAAVVEAAIDGELNEARVATKRTKNARVKSLADRIAADEGSAGAELTALEGRHPMAPEHTKASDDLKAANASHLMTLRATHGAKFDDAYIDEQVATTTRLLELLDGTLIPSADAPELRAELSNLRTMIAAQATIARDTQAAYRSHLEATTTAP
jgi:predicted outer membrane protein